MIATLLAALTVIAPAAEKTLPPGRLCLDRGPCIATESSTAHVPIAAERRRFVWIAEDGSVVTLGSIDEGASAVELQAGISRVLHIRTSRQTQVAFELTSTAERWQWTMPEAATSIRLIHPPCVDCVLSAEADGFRRFEESLTAVNDVVLQAWPRVRGRVIDRATGTPLAGATISASNTLIGKAGANGAFDVFIEEQWPHALDIVYPDRAPRRVELPVAATDTTLPPIALSTGGSLRMTIDPPIAPEETETPTWEIRDLQSNELLRQGPAAHPHVTVDGLGEGKYLFVLRGTRPLQQFGTPIEIESELVTEATIRIEPATLDLEVMRGSKAFAHAKTVVEFTKLKWSGELALDEHGRSTQRLWQRGAFSAALYDGERAIYLDIKQDVDSERNTWSIVIPDRRLIGQVTDAATGAAIDDARLFLSSERGAWGARSDATGHFVFEAMDAGAHQLTVNRDGYARAEGIEITIGESDGTYTHDVQLRSRATGRPLTVTDQRGLPIEGALLILASVDGIREIGFTQPDGTSSIPLRANDRGVVFVIPRSGSFAFRRVGPSDDEDGAIAVRVPVAAATIDVQTHSADEPLPNVLLVARVDGMMLPAEVIDALQRMQGVSFFTDARGRAHLAGMPRGVYEWWAVTGRDAMRAVRSPSPPAPDASLEVIAGNYDIRIGFTAPRATR